MLITQLDRINSNRKCYAVLLKWNKCSHYQLNLKFVKAFKINQNFKVELSPSKQILLYSL